MCVIVAHLMQQPNMMMANMMPPHMMAQYGMQMPMPFIPMMPPQMMQPQRPPLFPAAANAAATTSTVSQHQMAPKPTFPAYR